MALITNTIATAELVGLRVYSLSAAWGNKSLDEESELDITVKCRLESLDSKDNGAFSTITIKVIQKQKGEEDHELFDIEMHGAYRWKSEVPTEHLEDVRVANMLGRPVYTAAVMELKRVSSSMDLGDLYLSPELPWPDDTPQYLSVPFEV